MNKEKKVETVRISAEVLLLCSKMQPGKDFFFVVGEKHLLESIVTILESLLNISSGQFGDNLTIFLSLPSTVVKSGGLFPTCLIICLCSFTHLICDVTVQIQISAIVLIRRMRCLMIGMLVKTTKKDPYSNN